MPAAMDWRLARACSTVTPSRSWAKARRERKERSAHNRHFYDSPDPDYKPDWRDNLRKFSKDSNKWIGESGKVKREQRNRLDFMRSEYQHHRLLSS